MSESSERITVSRETLRAELNDLKLDLVDRINAALSTKADSKLVEQLDTRVTQLELNRAAREQMPAEILDLTKRVGALEKFRYTIPSVAVISALISFALLVYYVTHGG